MEKYRIDQSKGLEFGLYTLGDHMPSPHTGERISTAQRIHEIIELAKLAEQAGIDFFSVGESHQEYFATQAHTVVLAAIAQATNTIKIASSSSIISTSDPVRVYEDFATGNVYRFITNHLGYDALTIAELYRERWNVELFFKWIKQHLHIKSFYGTSENAVYTQIWIAVCAFLLLAIVKKHMHIEEPSLYMISQTIGTMLFERIPIPELFNKPINNVPKDDGQLDLFRNLKS